MNNKKFNKIVKVVIILSIIILICDLCLFLYQKNKNDSKKTFFNTINSFVYDNDSIYAVGSTNQNKNNIEEATLYKYNSNFRLINKYTYNSKYNSTFFKVKKDDKYLLALGSLENSKDENKDGERTALFVKYDLKGNKVFEKKVQILGVSKFTNILVLKDSYIVIGQSIYPNDVLGNENTGGAIIIKYSKDGKELKRSNLGGNKSGLFNDLVLVKDKIFVVGKDATRYGIIAKYDLDLNKEKAVSLGKTDTLGFSSIVYYKNNLYVVGAKKLNEADEYDHDLDAFIVKYNMDLKEVKRNTYKDTKNGIERYNNLIVDNDKIVVVGHEAILNKKKSNKKELYYNYRGLINVYNNNLKLINKNIYKKYSNNYFTEVNKYNKLYVVSGYNSNNNKYSNMFISYNSKLK